jgi:hypothetical protein
MTEKNTKSFEEWTDEYVRDNIHKLKAPMVQDRKTGEWYNPQERFDALMNKPEIVAVFKRLKDR